MTTTTDAAIDAAPVEPSARRLSGWQKAIGVLGLVVVFWVGDRLYDVIDSGGVSSGGDHAPGGSPTSQPTDTDNSTPGGTTGGGGHDPSQFDH
ncbi:MAG: hypothetical protein ACRDWI_09810 [Jiangellaceae bacterium]